MHRPLLSLSLLCVAACAGRDDRDRPDGHDAGVKVAFDAAKADSAATAPLAPGDVRVTSTDGAVILALVGDSVRFQLSDSLRNKVRQDIDTAGGSGFGNMIARSVSGVVSSAMGFVASVPVREIEDVRYEDGMIKFESRGTHGRFRMGGKGEHDDHGRFAPADGERFVAAVKARQAELAR